MSTHLAIDIGGSHGRGVLGCCKDGQWTVREVGRFSAGPVLEGGELYWDLEGIISGIREILRNASLQTQRIDSVAVDTMGLAFALLDSDCRPIVPLVYTRTPQEESLKQEILCHFGRERLYAITGLEQQKLNSLYYLAKLKREHPESLKRTTHFLMLPDFIHYLLTGILCNSDTIAATSNLWNIQKRAWSEEVLNYLGLPSSIFSPIVKCGERIGSLKPEWQLSAALENCEVIAAATHDTASALCSLSETEQNQLFISAGTWGMIGCCLDEPLLIPAALDAGFANEGAADGKIKFLNNAPCMSILLACIQHWQSMEADFAWDELFLAAEKAASTGSRIDLYHPDFRGQKEIPEKIRQYCRETGQAVPKTVGEITLTVLESVAEHFAKCFRDLKRLTGKSFEYAVMVGGGSQNRIFVEKCEQALGLPIRLGPQEASVMGNLSVQHRYFDRI